MPIYAYLCKDCGFEKDALQKLSDPPADCVSFLLKDQLRKKAYRTELPAEGNRLVRDRFPGKWQETGRKSF